MSRLPLLLLLLAPAGCAGGSLLNPYDRAEVPRVTVDAPPGAPPTFRWAPPDAEWVEVREAAGRVVWRVVEGGGMHGPVPVRSPLAYGAGAPREVNPPDDAVARSVVGPEPLRPGAPYTVVVRRRDARAAASGGGFTGVRPNVYEGTATFTAPGPAGD
jgi:hypothetical protein